MTPTFNAYGAITQLGFYSRQVDRVETTIVAEVMVLGMPGTTAWGKRHLLFMQEIYIYVYIILYTS